MEGPLSWRMQKSFRRFSKQQSSRRRWLHGWILYVSFFDLLGHHLVASFNAAYDANELTISQRRGVITLIPKEDGPLLELSNWRPATLVNVDCKIATKAIAKRIEPLLPNLVHTDQTGFIKGRYIGENIRLIIQWHNGTYEVEKHTCHSSISRFSESFWFSRMVVHDESTGYIQFRCKY